MSKIITIDYTTDPPKINNNNVGEVGENRAVTLHCIPESIEGVALYVMYFTVEGGVMPSKTFDVSESIDILLTEELTQQEEMECQLIGLSSLGEGAMVVAKSPIVHLWLGESIDGEVVTDPETGDTIFDQIQELKELAERIPNADEIPTEGSRNYVTSDGVYNTMISIEEDIPKNVSQLTNDADYVDGTRLNNKLLDYTLDVELASVAKSGRYSDLKAVPDLSIYTIDSTLDKVAKSGLYSDLKNKPAFSDVALSGNYNDLTNKPNLNVYAKSTDVAYTYQPKAEMSNFAKVDTLPNAYKDLSLYTNTPQFVKTSELNTKLDKYALSTDLNAYQPKLTSANAGTNITIENGVISASGGGASVDFDEEPTPNSTNAVRSRGIYTALTDKQDVLEFDTKPTENSDNMLTSGNIYKAYKNAILTSKLKSMYVEGTRTDVYSTQGTYAAIEGYLTENSVLQLSDVEDGIIDDHINALIDEKLANIPSAEGGSY